MACTSVAGRNPGFSVTSSTAHRVENGRDLMTGWPIDMCWLLVPADFLYSEDVDAILFGAKSERLSGRVKVSLCSNCRPNSGESDGEPRRTHDLGLGHLATNPVAIGLFCRSLCGRTIAAGSRRRDADCLRRAYSQCRRFIADALTDAIFINQFEASGAARLSTKQSPW